MLNVKYLTSMFLIFCLFLKLESSEMNLTISKHPIAVIETNYGAIEVLLMPETAPIAVENFIQLSKLGYYNNTPFHRVIPGFMIQGGDFTNGNGTGGHSIWGQDFNDEFSESLIFDMPGKLAMANSGKNTNGSQFFITTVATPWLNGKHTIFGQVVKGFSNVLKIESLGSASGQISQPWFGEQIEIPTIKSIHFENLE